MQRKKKLKGAAIASNWDHSYADKKFREKKTPVATYALAAFTLAFIFAFAGHYMGQNASARTAPAAEDEFADLLAPASTAILRKGSLLTSPEVQQFEAELAIATQEILASRKSDFLIDESLFEDPLGDGRTLVSAPATGDLEDSNSRSAASRSRSSWRSANSA